MRKVLLFFSILLALSIRAQVVDSFNDGNFTYNPTWSGHTQNFVISSDLQLQSKASTTSFSWLTTPSVSINDATWQCKIKLNFTASGSVISTSTSNYSCFYIVADSETLADNMNGYYVQVGGTNDEVSLFYQQEKTKTKIIDGIDKRTDGTSVELTIKVTRDKLGNFCLYSKKSTETDFVKEGECLHEGQKTSSFVGLLFANTTTTGSSYYFDDILVTGNAELDTISPEISKFELLSDTSIQLYFSEKVALEKAQFTVDNNVNSPKTILLDATKRFLKLHFEKKFEKGIVYNIQYTGITDIAGNISKTSSYEFGILEHATPGDVVINEIMFDAPEGGQEYVELMNVSNKLLDASQFVITTRKSDANLNTGIVAQKSFLMQPGAIVAWALNPDSVKTQHHTPSDANFVATDKWNALNNDASTLVISNLAKDTVFDEVSYSSTWHHVLITEPKGIALERILPNASSQDRNNWHSAATNVNFGTPGYQNSQFYDNNKPHEAKIVWLEPESFSPNNDGINDICFIRYDTEYSGFVCNVRVFNPSGLLIAHPAKSALLSADGYFIWDGRTLKGTIAETGIYVLYIEMFNANTGKKIEKKIPLVVTGR